MRDKVIEFNSRVSVAVYRGDGIVIRTISIYPFCDDLKPFKPNLTVTNDCLSLAHKKDVGLIETVNSVEFNVPLKTLEVAPTLYVLATKTDVLSITLASNSRVNKIKLGGDTYFFNSEDYQLLHNRGKKKHLEMYIELTKDE